MSEHRSETPAFHKTFTYDPVGNRFTKNEDGALTTSTYDAANQLETATDAEGETEYTLDASGNQQIVVEPSGERTTKSWDYENQLIGMELPGGNQVTMTHNATNRRVRKES